MRVGVEPRHAFRETFAAQGKRERTTDQAQPQHGNAFHRLARFYFIYRSY